MKKFSISIVLLEKFRDLNFCCRNICSKVSNALEGSSYEQAKNSLQSIDFLKNSRQKKIVSSVE